MIVLLRPKYSLFAPSSLLQSRLFSYSSFFSEPILNIFNIFSYCLKQENSFCTRELMRWSILIELRWKPRKKELYLMIYLDLIQSELGK